MAERGPRRVTSNIKTKKTMNTIEITVQMNGTETQYFSESPKTADQLLATAAFCRQFGVSPAYRSVVNGESGGNYTLQEGDVVSFEARAGEKA